MTLTQNQADAFRWLAYGKKVEAVNEMGSGVLITPENISHYISANSVIWTFRLAQETITATFPKPCNVYEFDDQRIILRFTTIPDRDAALAAISKEME